MPKDSTDSIHLVTRGHWTKWFLQLQHLCVSKGIWKDVKPTREKIAPLTPGSTPEDSKDFIRINPDYADDWLTKDPPHLIEISELIKRNDAMNTEKYNRSLEHHKAHSKDDEGDEKMQLPPTPSPCTFQDISAEYSALQGEYRSKRDTYNLMHKSYQDVYQWITETVDSSHLMEITIENDNSTALPLRMIILKLHDKLAPTLTTAKSAVAQEYRNVLQQAVLGRSDPIKWHNDWTKAYTNAKAYHVEVDDDLALINFLQAVGTRMLPTWSSAMLIQIETNNQLGLPNYSLKQYGDIFGGLAYQDSLSPKGKGIFSTLSPSTNKLSNQAVKPREFRGKEKDYRRHSDPYRCPCRAEADWKNNGSDSKHLAKDCEILQYVFTGKTGSLKTPNLSVKECNDIRHRAKDERWNSIRKIWGNKNWIPSSVATSSTNPIDPGARFNACLIQGQLGRGIYNTMESTPHPLTQCTVFDTGGAMHLVNDISLLDGQEYTPSPSSDYVESGTTRIPIIGRGTRTIKGITIRPDSEPNGDLILSNVAYIPGFHVNIVSETKLREAGLWFLGMDSTLRYGTLNNNSIVIQCIRKDNLLFLEYKPFSSYSQSLMNIPVNPSILMCPTINKKINRSFRKSYDPPKPREDSAELWHERSGHLGKEALEHLVFAARNVKIKGITRSDCADCARTHAKQVISRSPSERRPFRPFYKIQWDLFDFPRSYTGSSWLLIIKEMYSGKIFSFPLYQKTHLEVFNTIQSFLAWVLLIGIMGNTIFENWIKQEGIELELSPPNTHESNGGSERAGQEIITKQIKMRISAGLPDRLWVEAAQAATYLYNISPRKAYSSDHTIDIFTEQELQEYAQQLDIQERLDAEGTIIRDEYDVITSQSGMPAALSTPTMRTSDTPTHEQDSGSEEALDVENLSHNERFDHDHTKEAARSTPITQPTIIQEQIDSMDYETTGHATDVVRGEYVSDTENHPTNDSDSYSVEEVTSPPRLPNLTRTIDQFKEDQLSLLPDQPLKRQRVMKIEIPKPTLDPSEYQIFDFNQDNPQPDYSPTHQHNTRRRLRLQEQAPKPSNKTFIGTLIASMSNGGSSRIKDFHETFWPSHPITEEGDDSFVTVHSVIAAAIRTKPNPPTLLNKDQLEALPKEPNKCVVLDRALYGLRDSPAIWFKDFSKTLKTIGLNQGKEEPCLFTNPDQTVLVLFFVDDIQIIYHKKDSTSADQIISGIKAAYELRELGDTEWFLGIRILRDREMGKLWLAHDTYIEKIAKKFELDKGNACTPLPLIEFVKFDGKATTTYVRTYQEKPLPHKPISGSYESS
ncbi:reverse transcriptase domain protein [Botrytis cinerea]